MRRTGATAERGTKDGGASLRNASHTQGVSLDEPQMPQMDVDQKVKIASAVDLVPDSASGVRFLDHVEVERRVDPHHSFAQALNAFAFLLQHVLGSWNRFGRHRGGECQWF